MRSSNGTKSLTAAVVVAVLVGALAVEAADFGTEITIYDGSAQYRTGWYGTQEDNEVEPGTISGQQWDMEGFFLDGSDLTFVGGYDQVNGQIGIRNGDLFLDVDGDYGANNNTFGYDYALDLDYGSKTYTIYELGAQAVLENVLYRLNENSNPWRYSSGGTAIGQGDLVYLEGLTSFDVGFSGGSHFATTVDIGFLGDDADFVSHYTMECGNDHLLGSGKTSASVPDAGSTMLLLGIALLGVEAARRKLGA